MKEVCILNKGDNVNKLSVSMGLSKDLKVIDKKLMGFRYVELSKGDDEIICVRNYQPYFIKEIDKDNTLLDIYASGYGIVGADNGIEMGDKVVVKKIEGLRYIVSPLEKLEDIATKLGVTKDEIIERNGLASEKLFVGQVLIV